MVLKVMGTRDFLTRYIRRHYVMNDKLHIYIYYDMCMSVAIIVLGSVVDASFAGQRIYAISIVHIFCKYIFIHSLKHRKSF